VEGSDGDDAAKDLKAILTGRLDAGHRSIRRKLRRFDSLSDDERHRLRRQLKRLRYGLEFCSALLPRKKTRQMIRALARAQDALGEYNDAVIALAAYRAHAESDPRAWFAAGWLSGQLPGTLDRCRDELEKLSAVAAPWGKYDRRGPPTRKNPTASAKC
jgi:CHAD domain-containing protein